MLNTQRMITLRKSTRAITLLTLMKNKLIYIHCILLYIWLRWIYANIYVTCYIFYPEWKIYPYYKHISYSLFPESVHSTFHYRKVIFPDPNSPNLSGPPHTQGERYHLFCTHFISLQPPVKPLFVLTLFVMLTTINSFKLMSMVIYARCKVPACSFIIFCTLHQMSRTPFLWNHMCFIIRAYL